MSKRVTASYRRTTIQTSCKNLVRLCTMVTKFNFCLGKEKAEILDKLSEVFVSYLENLDCTSQGWRYNPLCFSAVVQG